MYEFRADSPPTVRACPRCGYDLRGLPAGSLCPECGLTVNTPGITDGTVTDNRPCLQCGYSLFGLASTGKCPECGVEVARSLQGNLLIYSSPDFVMKLGTGATCVLAGLALYAIWIACQFVPVFRGGQELRTLIGLLSIAASATGLAGWWLLSSPDPALVGQDRATGARRILRVTLIISISVFVFGTIVQGTLGGSILRFGSPSVQGLGGILLAASMVVTWIIWPIKTIASLAYVRSLSMRIPSLGLAQRAKRLIQFAIGGAITLILTAVFLLAVSAGGPGFDALGLLALLPVCGTFIGMLIWWIVYAMLIGGLRADLARISSAQASPATQP